MKRLIFLILITGFFMNLTGCMSKNEVELYPCDTNNVSYSKHVQPIIQANCYKCHDDNNAVLFGDNHHLGSYDSLKAHIKEGLIGNIEHAPNFLPMPKGDKKLNDCDIAKIKAWVNQDTLNN
jgi:hypothetical protein